MGVYEYVAKAEEGREGKSSGSITKFAGSTRRGGKAAEG